MYEIIKNETFVGYGESLQGGRHENQDKLGFNAKMPDRIVLTVCDGMGGAAGGQTASTIAVDEIVKYLSDTSNKEEPLTRLCSAIRKANLAVYERAKEDPSLRGMGTTTTIVMIDRDAAYTAYVGDSRIYQLRNGKKVYRTFDHSRVFELVKGGVLTEEQARVHPNSNIITRALGIRPEIEIETKKLEYRKGDRFVLCCDGVWNTMPEPELISMMTAKGPLDKTLCSITDKVQQIGEAKGGDYDNLTAIMLDVFHDSSYRKGFLRRFFPWFFTFIFCLLSTLTIQAQSFYWQPLDEYTSLERISSQLIIAHKGNKIGIIDNKARVIVPIEHDSISPFYEKRALVFDREPSRLRICGVLTLYNKRYTSFPHSVYALKDSRNNDYPVFFSEGLLTVMDWNGKKGYVNESGSIVIPCEYTTVFPFSEGYAAVVKDNKEWKLIDTKNHNVPIITPKVMSIASITNVFNGSLIYSSPKGEYYKYYLSTRKSEPVNISGKLLRDYLGRYRGSENNVTSTTGFGRKVTSIPYYSFPLQSSTPNPIKMQFQWAEDNLYFNTAIACLGKIWGILTYDEDALPFSATVYTDSHKYKHGDLVNCSFVLTTPNVWKKDKKNLSITLTDIHGKPIVVTANDYGEYHFRIHPHPSRGQSLLTSETYNLLIKGHGLTLYEKQLTYQFRKEYDNLVVGSLHISGNQAGVDNKVRVTADVYNPNPEAVTTTIHMNGSHTFHKVTQTVTIPAHSHHTVSSYFDVRKVIAGASFSVYTKDLSSNTASKSGIDMKPRD